jgi:Response regulators consisting of a CheY-like receiver domain and a winged-helix DNA-binding domain
MQHMLIADDNREITDMLSTYSRMEGYEPIVAQDGDEAFQLFSRYEPEVVLLEVMLPKEDGYEICRKIRSISNVPIIFITTRGDEFDRILGLDLGADDYILKPFSPREVMARIRAIKRRMIEPAKEPTAESTYKISDLEINLDEYILHIGDSNIPLTKKEIETMWTLATNPNKVFTRDNLLDSLWGYDYFGDSRTVDSHIKRLRSKLDVVDHPTWNIKTIWGVGYKFEIEE